MSDEKFVPNSVFAARDIRFWAQFTKEELLRDWGLNEKQIPLLEAQLSHVELKLREKTKIEEQNEVQTVSIESEPIGGDVQIMPVFDIHPDLAEAPTPTKKK